MLYDAESKLVYILSMQQQPTVPTLKILTFLYIENEDTENHISENDHPSRNPLPYLNAVKAVYLSTLTLGPLTVSLTEVLGSTLTLGSLTVSLTEVLRSAFTALVILS